MISTYSFRFLFFFHGSFSPTRSFGAALCLHDRYCLTQWFVTSYWHVLTQIRLIYFILCIEFLLMAVMGADELVHYVIESTEVIKFNYLSCLEPSQHRSVEHG